MNDKDILAEMLVRNNIDFRDGNNGELIVTIDDSVTYFFFRHDGSLHSFERDDDR